MTIRMCLSVLHPVSSVCYTCIAHCTMPVWRCVYNMPRPCSRTWLMLKADHVQDSLTQSMLQHSMTEGCHPVSADTP
jgi:hypothetical protein